MDNQSITHARWNCTYHIVFISKYTHCFYSQVQEKNNV